MIENFRKIILNFIIYNIIAYVKIFSEAKILKFNIFFNRRIFDVVKFAEENGPEKFGFAGWHLKWTIDVF